MKPVKYFCNDCYYWFRSGGFIKRADMACPECHSQDVVAKNFTTEQVRIYQDMRVKKQRGEIFDYDPAEDFYQDQKSESVAQKDIVALAGQGGEGYSVAPEQQDKKWWSRKKGRHVSG